MKEALTILMLALFAPLIVFGVGIFFWRVSGEPFVGGLASLLALVVLTSTKTEKR